jgi:hypothetical protein
MVNMPMPENKQDQAEQPRAPSVPNDTGGILVQGFVKITDPNTKEVIVEKRA